MAQIEPDWSSRATNIANATNAPGDRFNRENIYQWPTPELWAEKIKNGQLHAVNYPIEATGLLMPARTTLKVLDAKPGQPLFELMRAVLSLSNDFKDFKGFWEWLGLTDYPEDGSIPYPDGVKPEYPMGVSIIERNGTKGFTLSCAACHSAELFGKSILGMTNRFSRANEFFMMGKKSLRLIPEPLFTVMTGATDGERKMVHDTKIHSLSVGIKKPQVLGLDTSLSQVALSLAKRSLDPWAIRTSENAKHPRPNMLDTQVADSKPAVWWNVKYKTKWLSDGSVVSGNPVFTNFLWNEIGRGVDLEPLVEWLKQNSTTVEELTTAVFASQPPKFRDFFGESAISIERAKKGAQLFNQNCNHCHGDYQKAWDLNPIEFANLRSTNPDLSLLDTVQVKYPTQTFIKDVGTDPGRRTGMKAMAEALNPLAFSQNFSIVVQEQPGYVPPPLDGIWARYPYFHNNAIPNLCALMNDPRERPATYYAGKAINKDLDYDQECLGYPLGNRTPASWKKNAAYFYDTSREGMSNSGHYELIFDGFTREEKSDLREFLKTL